MPYLKMKDFLKSGKLVIPQFEPPKPKLLSDTAFALAYAFKVTTEK